MKPVLRLAALGLAIGLQPAGWGATIARAQSVHTAGCSNCHRTHGVTGATLTNYAVSEDLCLSCHVDGGDPNAPKGVAIHVSARYSATVTCVSCHGHRGNAGGNLALIRDSIGTPNSGRRDVAFTSRGTDAVAGTPPSTLPGAGPALNSFADGDAALDGVCEVCHTQTGNHQNGTVQPDLSNHTHNAGLQCTKCHQHRDGTGRGFTAPACAACHNTGGAGTTGPNNRRPIIPEFARPSHHVGSAYKDSDCQACHYMGQHQQGQVRLRNADNPATVYALTGNPATTPAVAATLTPFCLSCHDGTGPAGRSRPFSDSVVVPTIDTARWAASAHKIAPAIAGCYGDGGSGCHATAHGSQKRRLLAPPTVAPTPPANAEEEEGFCFTCHDGSPASTNIQGQFQKGTNTSTQTFHHPVNDSQQLTGRPVECTNCHNPHQATSANRLRGATGIDLRGNAVGPGTSNSRDPFEYEVCLACHGDAYLANRDLNGDGYFDTSNKRRDFNDSASAYHPVQQAGRNQSGALQAQLLGGLTSGSTITCSDCHNNEQTRNAQGPAGNSVARPQGPHGSTIFPILRDTSDLRAIQNAGGARAGQFRLCFLCHNQNMLISADTYGGGARTNFYGGSKDNLHWFHLTDFGGATCRTCHYNTHGNRSASNTIYRILDGATTSYTSPPVGYKTRNVNFSPSVSPRAGETKPVWRLNVATRARGCLLVCHGKDHDGTGDFTYTPQARHGVAGQDNDALKYVP